MRTPGIYKATKSLLTQAGIKSVWRLDEEMRDPAHNLNPRTTSDIVTAVLALSILGGYRP